MTSSFSKIGVWQTAFLGDAVLTLPLLQTLGNEFPDSELHFFVRKGLKPLFQPNPGFQTHEFDKYGADKGLKGLLRTVGRIKKTGAFDIWISPHASLRSTLIAFLLRSGLSIGYNRPLPNMAVYSKTVSRRFSELDEIERILELASPLNIKTTEYWPRIILDEQARDEAALFWSRNITGKTLGIHPGSTWPTKMWPAEYFAETLKMAGRCPDLQIILFGGPGEEPVVKSILCSISDRSRIINLAGKLTLPRLAAYFSRLDCCLTNDSGPMHLAWTQNIPLISIFGPTTKNLGFFPRGKHSTVMENLDLKCRPCGLHGHKHCPEKHHKCMKDILPHQVMAQVRKKLYE